MKKFLQNIIGYFILPIALFTVTSELLLRNIPNNYKSKRQYLDGNSDSIETLVLGNSHAYFGVDPAYLHTYGFNASYVSQSLNFDLAIMKKYTGKWKNLKCIILPVSYFTFYHQLEKSPESWRACNYVIYSGLSPAYRLTDYSEILSNKLRVNLERITSYYFFHTKNPSCSKLGWGTNYSFKAKQNLMESGRVSAKKHYYKDSASFQANLAILRAIIDYAKERNVKVLLFTPPAFHTYTDNLDAKQLRLTISMVNELDKAYPNVVYANLLTDSTFTERDFYDADHLDEFGAEKLTLKLDSIIRILTNPLH